MEDWLYGAVVQIGEKPTTDSGLQIHHYMLTFEYMALRDNGQEIESFRVIFTPPDGVN
jgi:hypothetical protein